MNKTTITALAFAVMKILQACGVEIDSTAQQAIEGGLLALMFIFMRSGMIKKKDVEIVNPPE